MIVRALRISGMARTQSESPCTLCVSVESDSLTNSYRNRTYLHTCYDRQHARTTVPTTSEAPLSLDCSTYNILHPQFSNQIAYAHRFALPGFRADARLHQRRHHGQEVRVDVCQIASVPILTNVVNTRSKTSSTCVRVTCEC